MKWTKQDQCGRLFEGCIYGISVYGRFELMGRDLFTSVDDDEAESYFGTCDLTGWRGNIVPCMALDADSDKVVEFGVLDTFVHGKLGRLAGAF